MEAPGTDHSLQPSLLPCSNPCHTKSLAVSPKVSVMSGKHDAATSASIPAVLIPMMLTFMFPWASSHFAPHFAMQSFGSSPNKPIMAQSAPRGFS